jgi:hypothetical protein
VQLRIKYCGALHHITSRGNELKQIVWDEEDRIETPEGNLSKGIRQLNGVYTQTLNKKYQRAGHIFQDGKASPCHTTDWILGQFGTEKWLQGKDIKNLYGLG